MRRLDRFRGLQLRLFEGDLRQAWVIRGAGAGTARAAGHTPLEDFPYFGPSKAFRALVRKGDSVDARFEVVTLMAVSCNPGVLPLRAGRGCPER